MTSRARLWDRGFGGSNVADFWVRLSYRYICSLTCCWKQFLVSRGLSADLQKYSKNEKFSLKNWKKCIFSILGGPNRLPGGWGGLGRLFGLPRGFTPNQCGSPQKKISDQAQPLPVQIDLSKSSIFAFFSPKKSNFWNCCRNFWQKVLPKFLATWWGPLTPEMSGDAVSWNFMYYSQSYEFLKIVKKCEKVLLFQRWEIPMNWYLNFPIFIPWICQLKLDCQHFLIMMFCVPHVYIYCIWHW